MIYLDANASEPVRPAALAAMTRAAAGCGNPSSVHAAGRAARRLLEDARELIAGRFGDASADVVFTSGATEALSLAVHGLGRGRRTIVCATEHDAVRAAAPGGVTLGVDADGRADLRALQQLLAAGGPALVCVMLANNETGTIQDIPAIAALCHAAGARLLVDAVQAAGRIAVDMALLGADALAVSSHKLGGPAGAGALLLAPTCTDIAPLIAGGGQERGRRGGTPSLPAIAGFAAAVAEAVPEGPISATLGGVAEPAMRRGINGQPMLANAMSEQPSPREENEQPWRGGESGQPSPRAMSEQPSLRGESDQSSLRGKSEQSSLRGESEHPSTRDEREQLPLRDEAERAAVAAGAVVIGGGGRRLPNTTCVALPGVRADTQVMALDLAGVCVSAGAACSSGKVARSHVLDAMGLGALAGEAIRVSLPWCATAADVAAFALAYGRMADRLRSRRAA